MKVDDEKKTYGGKKTNEKFGSKKRFDNDRKDKKFGKGGQKFKKSDGFDKRDKKFGAKKRGIDKTNSQNRDHRPIGGGHSKIGRKKYNSKKR